MATAQTVIDASIARLKDQRIVQWRDTELLEYLNRGVEHVHSILVAADSDLIVSTKQTALSGATSSNTLETDFLALLKDGVVIDDVPLEPCSFSEYILNAGATGTPKKFYLENTKIYFVPALNGSYTLDVYYYPQHTTLALGTTMPYNSFFDVPLSVFMTAMAFLRADRPKAELDQIYVSLGEAVMDVLRKRAPDNVARRLTAA